MKTLLVPATPPPPRPWPRGGSDLAVDTEFARIIDELTRRGLLGGGLGSAALLGLAACGSGHRPAASTAANTRVVDTSQGKVAIPADPKRIVCVDPYTPFDLLGVGVVPVGVAIYTGAIAPSQSKLYGSLPKIDTASGDTNLEEVARLRPDVIFGLSYIGSYDKLTAIAPTVFFPFATSTDWPTIANARAAAVGRDKQERALSGRYSALARQISAGHAKTLAHTRWDMVSDAGNGQFAVYFPDSGNGHVLADAGVRFASASAGKTGATATLSYENLDTLDDADVLLYNASSTVGNYKSLLDSPLWKSLPAVRAGHAYPVTDTFPNNYEVAVGMLNQVQTALTDYEDGK